jgi:hypothetical protein
MFFRTPTGLHSNSGTVARMLGTVARTELAEADIGKRSEFMCHAPNRDLRPDLDYAPDRDLEIVVAALADRFSPMNSRSRPRGMPECAAAFSARWYSKNDVHKMPMPTDAGAECGIGCPPIG